MRFFIAIVLDDLESNTGNALGKIFVNIVGVNTFGEKMIKVDVAEDGVSDFMQEDKHGLIGGSDMVLRKQDLAALFGTTAEGGTVVYIVYQFDCVVDTADAETGGNFKYHVFTSSLCSPVSMGRDRCPSSVSQTIAARRAASKAWAMLSDAMAT